MGETQLHARTHACLNHPRSVPLRRAPGHLADPDAAVMRTGLEAVGKLVAAIAQPVQPLCVEHLRMALLGARDRVRAAVGASGEQLLPAFCLPDVRMHALRSSLEHMAFPCHGGMPTVVD